MFELSKAEFRTPFAKDLQSIDAATLVLVFHQSMSSFTTANLNAVRLT
jgi:hypothetical protein